MSKQALDGESPALEVTPSAGGEYSPRGAPTLTRPALILKCGCIWNGKGEWNIVCDPHTVARTNLHRIVDEALKQQIFMEARA